MVTRLQPLLALRAATLLNYSIIRNSVHQLIPIYPSGRLLTCPLQTLYSLLPTPLLHHYSTARYRYFLYLLQDMFLPLYWSSGWQCETSLQRWPPQSWHHRGFSLFPFPFPILCLVSTGTGKWESYESTTLAGTASRDSSECRMYMMQE